MENSPFNVERHLTSQGPKQSRKPPVAANHSDSISSPSFTSYDPKVLLNPKSAASRRPNATASDDINTNGDLSNPQPDKPGGNEDQVGMSSFIDRIHHTTKREDAPQRKRKLETIEDEDDDSKKAKATFTGGGKGGMLSDHMRAERERLAAEAGPAHHATIDLTNEDEEVVFVKSNQHEEVCLGVVHAQVNCFRVPYVGAGSVGKVGKDHWPMSRVFLDRKVGQNKIIDVLGKSNHKFGSLQLNFADALAPLMDGAELNRLRTKAFLEARKKQPGEQVGDPTSQSLRLQIVMYAPRRNRDQIGRYLSKKQIFLSNPLNVDNGKEIDNPHVPKLFHNPQTSVSRKPQSSQFSYVVRSAEEMKRDATSMFDSLTKTEELPEMDANSSLIATELMPHQKQALRFLTEHEETEAGQAQNNKTFSLWKAKSKPNGKEFWYNVITGQEATKKPEAARGGILADMMGLGKTLSILALISETHHESMAFGYSEDLPDDADDVVRNVRGTLIVCPKSVMSNWTEQVQVHVRPNKLRVYSYHGSNRIQDLDELAKNDIVLVPYGTVAAEFGNTTKKRNALASVQWFRIVLDEAHQIRTTNTRASKACCALAAQRRWAVTGTPVQNSLHDLGALIKFLRIKPFDEPQNWAQYIMAPFKNANSDVLQHLRLLVDSITLRRMKDNIEFTQRREQMIRLNFSEDEEMIYKRFASQSNLQLKIMIKDGKGFKGKSYAHVLRSLLRMRLICAHGRELLSEDDIRELEGMDAGNAIEIEDEPQMRESFVSDKQAYDMLHVLNESDMDRCMRCNEKLIDKKADRVGESDDDTASDTEDDEDDTVGYLTPCYHVICPKHKDAYIDECKPRLTADHFMTCPQCESYVRYGLFGLTRSGYEDYLDAKANATKKPKKAKWDPATYSGPHTKVKALLEDLKKSAEETARLPLEEPPIRSVVFTSWTSYLDLIEYALDENNIGYKRLDGSMSVKARTAVLNAFKSEPNITVLLVSIKAGGQGLNFTAANKVYMMEPQFNPGVEQQAIDRVHRLGQTRDVEIVHYIMNKSVEEGILTLQEKKTKLAELSLERKMSKSDEAKQRIEELRALFK